MAKFREIGNFLSPSYFKLTKFIDTVNRTGMMRTGHIYYNADKKLFYASASMNLSPSTYDVFSQIDPLLRHYKGKIILSVRTYIYWLMPEHILRNNAKYYYGVASCHYWIEEG